jgi:hypothetical protein
MPDPNLETNGQPKAAKRTRSDKGTKRKKPDVKKPAVALIDVLAALDGLDDEGMRKVLSAAAIFHNIHKPDGE